MTTLTKTSTGSRFSIHPSTHLGPVSLTIGNLENQLDFYQRGLGLQLHWRRDNRAGLGVGGPDLLQLVEQAGVRKYRDTTGLYHLALVYPSRRDLARAVARLFSLKVRNYPTDHIMTKSTYLDDPEGNGIELYAESPEDGTFTIAEDGGFLTRRSDGSLSDGREPLDLEALFALLKDEDRLDLPLASAVHMGHVHLHVRDVREAVDFYHGVIGFDLMGLSTQLGAAFVSAGGYHHHIGLNTWKGVGAPPPPPDASGLRFFSILLPDPTALAQVQDRLVNASFPMEQTGDGLLLHDPSHNGILLKTDG